MHSNAARLVTVSRDTGRESEEREIGVDSFRFSLLYFASVARFLRSRPRAIMCFPIFRRGERRVTQSLYPASFSIHVHSYFLQPRFRHLARAPREFPAGWKISPATAAEPREIEFSAPLVKWNSIISNTVEPRLKKNDRKSGKRREQLEEVVEEEGEGEWEGTGG